MTYKALVSSFADTEELPISVNAALDWIRNSTDHKDIRLHPVNREKQAFRGACRRVAVPTGAPYSGDFEVITEILFGEDLSVEWRRLVICKEALHVFDSMGERVNTPEKIRLLIPSVIVPGELKGEPFWPGINDHFGVFRAMAVLIPTKARGQLAEALDNGSRTSSEIAHYVQLPEVYVDIWLRHGDKIEAALMA